MMAINSKNILYVVIGVPVLIHILVVLGAGYKAINSDGLNDEIYTKHTYTLSSYECSNKLVKRNKVIELKLHFTDQPSIAYEISDQLCVKVDSLLSSSLVNTVTIYFVNFAWYENVVQTELNGIVLDGLNKAKERFLNLFKVIFYLCIPMACLGCFTRYQFKRR